MRQVSDDSDIFTPPYLLTNHDSASSVLNGGIYDLLKETSVDSDADDAGIETFSVFVFTVCRFEIMSVRHFLLCSLDPFISY